jgi:hypothetical protein
MPHVGDPRRISLGSYRKRKALGGTEWWLETHQYKTGVIDTNFSMNIAHSVI